MNVSRDSVYMAQTVLRKGVPELQHAVDSGQVSVAAAAAVAGLPRKEQKKAVAGGEKALVAKAKEVRQQKAGSKTNTKSSPGKGSQSVMAMPAATQEEAPQISTNATNLVGPNSASPEPPAPEAPTTQSVSSPGKGTQERTPTGAQPASPGGKNCITLDLDADPQDLAGILVKGLGSKRAKKVSEAMTKLLNSRKDSQPPTHTNKGR
jgi:hypothetical protein